MAILQQQQQGIGGPKLSPPPMGGQVPKHPDAHLHPLGMNAHKQPDGPVHAAMGGSELHSKAPAAFTGEDVQGVDEFVYWNRSGEMQHYITCSLIDPLQ